MTLAPVSVVGSGRRRAAVTLVALGAERSAALLREMSEAEVRAIAAEVAVLGPVTPEEVRAALHELNDGLNAVQTLPAPGTRFARDLLERTLGPQRGDELAGEIESPPPFAWLAEAEPEQVCDALAKESPGAIALALVHLMPQDSVRLLTLLPEELRSDVVQRIASLRTVHPETIAEVDHSLRSRLANSLVTEAVPVAGTAMLAEMLQLTSRDNERALLNDLAAAAPELADLVKAALFTFDDVAALEPRSLQVVLKAVETRDLARALKGASDEKMAPILANISERAREDLLEEIDLLPNLRPAEITQARMAIVASCRRLEEEGTITITRAADDE